MKIAAKRKSATLLTIFGVVGLVATAISSARAAPKAIKLLEEKGLNKETPLLEKVKIAAPVYIPTVAIGVSSALCIIGSNILNKRAQAGLIGAYTLIEQTHRSYRRKVRELYGDEADQKIVEELAIERADKIYVSGAYIGQTCNLSLDESTGNLVLFYDNYSKRYFESTVEQVINAEYHLNRNYILRGYSVLNELYDFLGLEPVDFGNDMGWAPTDEGEYWIDFNHRRSTLPNGKEFYILEMPFGPRLNYDDYDC